MNSVEQVAILDKRQEILDEINGNQGTLAERLQSCVHEVSFLGALIHQWVDNMAIVYRDMGCTIDEWYDDVVEWLELNHFKLFDVQSKPQTDGTNVVTMHCHLHHTGYGKNVVIKFSLMR